MAATFTLGLGARYLVYREGADIVAKEGEARPACCFCAAVLCDVPNT